jgi:hypothetical protein
LMAAPQARAPAPHVAALAAGCSFRTRTAPARSTRNLADTAGTAETAQPVDREGTVDTADRVDSQTCRRTIDRRLLFLHAGRTTRAPNAVARLRMRGARIRRPPVPRSTRVRERAPRAPRAIVRRCLASPDVRVYRRGSRSKTLEPSIVRSIGGCLPFRKVIDPRWILNGATSAVPSVSAVSAIPSRCTVSSVSSVSSQSMPALFNHS